MHFLFDFIPHLITLPLYIGLLLWCIRRFALPAGARYAAVVLKLAERRDVRAVPLLISSWLVASPIGISRLPDVENALIALTENAAPGSVPLSDKPRDKDPAAFLRARFAQMTHKQKGATFFTPAATQNARRVQLFLALLPHLAADANPKSQAVLAGLLDAPAKTLDEETLQNAVRRQLTDSAPQMPSPPVPAAALPLVGSRYAETVTRDEPRLQRQGRR